MPPIKGTPRGDHAASLGGSPQNPAVVAPCRMKMRDSYYRVIKNFKVGTAKHETQCRALLSAGLTSLKQDLDGEERRGTGSWLVCRPGVHYGRTKGPSPTPSSGPALPPPHCGSQETSGPRGSEEALHIPAQHSRQPLSSSMEMCDQRHNITMCPLCDKTCSYWKMSSACATARASHLFDNPATVFFSVFMALWGKQSACAARPLEAAEAIWGGSLISFFLGVSTGHVCQE